MGVIWILLASAAVIILEKNNMAKHWSTKEKIVFFFSLSIGTAIAIAWVLQVELLNPMDILANIYRPVSEPLTSYLNQFK